MHIDEFVNFLSKFEAVTKKPEKYLSLQDETAEEIKQLTQKLYGFTKSNEYPTKPNDALNELVIENLDEEQIWQQVELQNNSIHNNLVNSVANLLSKKEKLTFPVRFNQNEDFTKVPKKGAQNGVGSSSEVESKKKFQKKDNVKENKIDKNKKGTPKKPIKSSVVDDKFFKLCEMEEFLKKMEDNNEVNEEEDEDFDYFAESSEESNEDDGPHYNDFFDEPDEKEESSSKRQLLESDDENKQRKKVKFALEDGINDSFEDNYSSDHDDNNNSDFDNESNDINFDENGDQSSEENLNIKKQDSGKEESNESPSTFEERQERLKKRIHALEESALKEKPWQMKGEIAAENRPQNSLLQEYVEFDVATRPAPVLTEKSTLKLEDIIIQRIKDKAWDDVIRKIKPIEGPMEFKKKLVLDQEKSKLSLAQVYEQEYLKQVEKKTLEDVVDKPEVEPPEHQEIRIMMQNLFSKLDALSNFHFTPRQVKADIKIVSNLPAISMEEVAPIATSDAALLAPEEVKAKPKGELIGKSERTITDKKRERRQKKIRQRLKFKKLEEKTKQKLENSKKNVLNKKLSDKLLQKITKSSNVTSLKETNKPIKSSTAFFSKLQDETNSKTKKDKTEVTKKKIGKKLKKKTKV